MTHGLEGTARAAGAAQDGRITTSSEGYRKVEDHDDGKQ